MSIFNPNYSLLNKYITEAEEDEDRYSINDSEFDIDDDEPEETNDSNDSSDAAEEIINSADEDNNEESDTSEDNDTNEENDTSEDNTESDNNEGDDSQEDSNESNETDEFDINLDGDDPSGEDSDGDNNDGSEEGDISADNDSESSDVTNELVEKEKEIFSDLSEKQMKIKTNELKKSYTTFLTVVDDISNKITSIPKNDANMKIIKFISSKLLDLKNIVNDYLVDTFDTKTYIENTIFYQTNLAQLNTIKKVLEDMAIKVENEDNKK